MPNTKTSVDPAHTLAAHVINTSIGDVPFASLTAARLDILDTFGAMLGGSGAPGIDQLVRVTRRWGGLEEVTLAVIGEKMPAHHAALINAAMGHALDFDDTYDEGGNVHPGTSVLAAGLAISESVGGISGEQLVLAVTLGLDVSCRLGLAAHDDRGWHRTASFGIFGATAAAGKLIGLSVEQMVHAFGIAYSQAAGNRQCIVDGALTKRFQAGQAAHGAVLSAVLAKEGFTGSENVFAGRFGFFPMYQPDGYDLSIIDRDLGEDFFGDRISFKPYPCVRPSHAYIDAAIKLHSELDLRQTPMESVTIRMDSETLASRYNIFEGVTKPTQQVEAQFSVPYLIGCALALGRVGIAQINCFDDPSVLAAAALVNAEDCQGAKKGWAEIEVVCVDGRFASVELGPASGSPENPLSIEQLNDKFRDCAAHAAHSVDKTAIEKMMALILNSDGLVDAADLIKLSLSSNPLN